MRIAETPARRRNGSENRKAKAYCQKAVAAAGKPSVIVSHWVTTLRPAKAVPASTMEPAPAMAREEEKPREV